MSAGNPADWSFETLAVRAGQERSQFNEHSEALYLTSSFVFDSAAQAAASTASTAAAAKAAGAIRRGGKVMGNAQPERSDSAS